MTERRHVSSGSPYEPKVGISRALRVGEGIVVSGFLDPRWKVEIEAEAQAG